MRYLRPMRKRILKRAVRGAPWLLLLPFATAFGRGVTPYLPLNLEPEIESQIERVLILGDKPVLTRPIAAATVLDALPKACKVDQALCERVERYLARYTHYSDLTHASVEGAATSGADDAVPNRYGMGNRSPWAASAGVYLQPSDYLLLSAGVVAYDGKVDPAGSLISLGTSHAQLDIGFRPQWLSPMTDSSMLMSTEAATMPSITLSNYEPMTRLGLHYEFFDARMSTTNHILFEDGDRSGHPYLAGMQISMEPVSGWSFAVNRLLQYGGAGRPDSLKDLFKAFFNPSRYDNTNPELSFDQQLGNQEASISSSFLFPGRVPFAVYAEYAGEDTSRGRSYLLGNAALSVGIHFPRLWERFDLTLESSEWQDSWYVHGVYQDGLVNDGRVVGNWFGDERVFNDGIGGRSQMAHLGWDAFGGLVDLRYRTLQNASYGANRYQRFHEITLGYSRPWRGLIAGGELDAGRDVFGDNFTRLTGFLRYNGSGGTLGSALIDALADSAGPSGKSGEIFVDAGVNAYKVRVDLTDEDTRATQPGKTGPHFALGARRAVTEHSDLGARVDFDEIEGHSLIGFRLVDYRYRFKGPLAVGAFLGAARYSLGTPAYGFYYGGGIQWRNVVPGVDVGAEFHFADSVARDHLLPSDPVSARPDSFYDVWGTILSASYHF